jgi:predicted enzyme related to lactoylglutathione lyase
LWCILFAAETFCRDLIPLNTTIMLGLRTTIYKVPDLAKAKAWYIRAFGTKPYFDEPFYVGFNIGGYELGLLPENGAANTADNVLSYWGIDDIQKSYDDLIALGATEHEKPTNVGGEIMTATVRDPWGNVIGLIYNPEFKLP